MQRLLYHLMIIKKCAIESIKMYEVELADMSPVDVKFTWCKFTYSLLLFIKNEI